MDDITAKIDALGLHSSTPVPMLKQILPEDIQIYQNYDAGGFADIYCALYNNEDAAVKIYKKKTDPKKEGHLLHLAQHPNIVTLYGYIDDSAYSALVMEFCDQSLNDYLLFNTIRGTESTRDKCALDIAKGLVYLHEVCRIIHRDIKPDNILIQKSKGKTTAKIADFGLSVLVEKPADEFVDTKSVGTASYCAPEVLCNNEEKNGAVYTFKTDIFSLGHIFHLLVQQKTNTSLPSKYDLKAVELGKVETMPLNTEYCTPAAIELITHCFKTNPELRPSAEEIVMILESKSLIKKARP